MSEILKVKGKSGFEATVDDVVLQEGKDLRLVFRPELVDHPDRPEAKLNGRFVRQKRHKRGEPWKDFDKFATKTMKSGEEVQIYLDADTLFSFFEELKQLYALPVSWSVTASKEYEVHERGSVYIARGHEKALLEKLMHSEGDRLWMLLDELGPGMVEAVALRKQHVVRQRAVDDFEQHMLNGNWDENEWQDFFQRNEWIFGHNLIFQFINTLANQAHVGGTTLSGRGGQRTDMLMHTEASARFTVLVDIKRPEAPLLDKGLYRNKVHLIGEDVIGGVSQIQSYCRTWVTEGSRQEENAEALRNARISTYEPRGILVVGNLSQLDDQNKRATFELYRRHLHNLEIITYDELLARAQFTVHVSDQD